MEIQLDKPRALGFTLGAMRRAKELGVLDTNAEDATAMMLALPEYVWACLDEEGRNDLTVKAIAELMNPINTPVIARKVGELFKASMPQPDPNAEPPAVKKPTGGKSNSKNSGRLVSTT